MWFIVLSARLVHIRVPGSDIHSRVPGDVKLSQVTKADGLYSFGPLDASVSYSVTAEKESYVFSEVELSGDVRAHRLAEIQVQLVDDSNNQPLEVTTHAQCSTRS